MTNVGSVDVAGINEDCIAGMNVSGVIVSGIVVGLQPRGRGVCL